MFFCVFTCLCESISLLRYYVYISLVDFSLCQLISENVSTFLLGRFSSVQLHLCISDFVNITYAVTYSRVFSRPKLMTNRMPNKLRPTRDGDGREKELLYWPLDLWVVIHRSCRPLLYVKNVCYKFKFCVEPWTALGCQSLGHGIKDAAT